MKLVPSEIIIMDDDGVRVDGDLIAMKKRSVTCEVDQQIGDNGDEDELADILSALLEMANKKDINNNEDVGKGNDRNGENRDNASPKKSSILEGSNSAIEFDMFSARNKTSTMDSMTCLNGSTSSYDEAIAEERSEKQERRRIKERSKKKEEKRSNEIRASEGNKGKIGAGEKADDHPPRRRRREHTHRNNRLGNSAIMFNEIAAKQRQRKGEHSARHYSWDVTQHNHSKQEQGMSRNQSFDLDQQSEGSKKKNSIRRNISFDLDHIDRSKRNVINSILYNTGEKNER